LRALEYCPHAIVSMTLIRLRLGQGDIASGAEDHQRYLRVREEAGTIIGDRRACADILRVRQPAPDP